MRVVVFLNGDRGYQVLQQLVDNSFNIVSIVTPLNFSLEKFPLPTNIPHIKSQNVNHNDTAKTLKELSADVFLIAGYSDIFKENVINIPKIMTLNLHAGKLPEYRGGSPLNWQIINGEKEAGLSVIKVDTGIDTGPIISETLIPISMEDTIDSLHLAANNVFPKLVEEALRRISDKSFIPKVQDEDRARYWHQRNNDDGRLNFSNLTSVQAYNFIRALSHPYPGAWSILNNDKIVRILKAEISNFNLYGTLGRICYIQGKGPYVVCKQGSLLISEYLIENEDNAKLKNGQHFI